MKSINKTELGFGAIALPLSLAVVVIIGFAGWYIYHTNHKTDNPPSNTSKKNSSANSKDTSPEIYAAKVVGDKFVLDLQNGDMQSADNLETTAFQQKGDVWGEQALQQYQSSQKAISSGWSVKVATNETPESAIATYTLYISVSGYEPTNYNMTLENMNNTWMVSDFEDSGN